MKTLKIAASLLTCALSSFGSVYAFHEEGGSGAFAGGCFTVWKDDRFGYYVIENKCGREIHVRTVCNDAPVSDGLMAKPDRYEAVSSDWGYRREGIYTRIGDNVNAVPEIGSKFGDGDGIAVIGGSSSYGGDDPNCPILSRGASLLLYRSGRFRLGAASLYV